MKSYITEYTAKNGMAIQNISHEYKLPDRKIGDIYNMDIIARDDNGDFKIDNIEFEVVEIKQYTKDIDEQIHLVSVY